MKTIQFQQMAPRVFAQIIVQCTVLPVLMFKIIFVGQLTHLFSKSLPDSLQEVFSSLLSQSIAPHDSHYGAI